MDGIQNDRNIAESSKLTDKAATRHKSPPDLYHDLVPTFHRMERGIGEYDIKLAGEGKHMAINEESTHSQRPRSCDYDRTRVDTDDLATTFGHLSCERAVTTPRS